MQIVDDKSKLLELSNKEITLINSLNPIFKSKRRHHKSTRSYPEEYTPNSLTLEYIFKSSNSIYFDAIHFFAKQKNIISEINIYQYIIRIR